MQLNKTKFNNKLHILSLFVRSFGSLQGAGLRPSEVVQVVRRVMDDWPATPQGSKRTTKPGNSCVFKITFSGKQTQFPNSENHCKLLQKRNLQRFTPPNPQKKQTQSKPNQSQYICPSTLYFLPLYSLGPKARNPNQTQFKPNLQHIFRGENFLQELTPNHHEGKMPIRHQFQELRFHHNHLCRQSFFAIFQFPA